jgi:uncharacterized protein (DUF952 family)
MIFHITEKDRFISSLESGSYTPENFTSDKFIHCSTKEQAITVANRYYAAQSDLILLAIDTTAIETQIIYENLDGGEELFPHLYGALMIRDIHQIAYLQWNESGFSFPIDWYPISDIDYMVK